MSYKEDFIEFMVRSGVLTFGKFTTKSGRKTPYFINTGNYKTGEQILKLGEYYAENIIENMNGEYDALFGPAYKGIPLAVSTAAALFENHEINMPYCFNRKEAKDHGEGGNIIGYRPKDGDRLAIIEDVVTAGTAVRESIDFFKGTGVKISALYISVDRMERGSGEKSTIAELREQFGIDVYPIVTVREIINFLHGKKIDGQIYIDDAMKNSMEEYLKIYGAG